MVSGILCKYYWMRCLGWTENVAGISLVAQTGTVKIHRILQSFVGISTA